MPEKNMRLTCETAGCQAENVPVDLVTDANQYMCGLCQEFITNAVQVVEEEVTDGSAEETV